MVEQRAEQTGWWRPVAIVAAALIVAFVTTGVTASEREAPPVHSAVADWMDANPGEPVPLIIQHDGTPDGLRSFVTNAGGSVEREFDIIPAFDVDVPAGRLDDLGRQDDVVWISLDAELQSTGFHAEQTARALATFYPQSVNAPAAWKRATGAGVTVALIDTGVSPAARQDFVADGGLRVKWVTTRSDLDAEADGFGHGTHVAGVIAGHSTATEPAGRYTGIAPQANVLSVRIGDDQGGATIGDLMAGLQFVDEHREDYNIRVLNLSVTSSVAQSYKFDPIDAAVEVLWFHDVAVIVAAGNDGNAKDAVSYPPANDPFVITVGAFDDMKTLDQNDDRLAEWSSRGNTQDGFAKPEVLGPGVDIDSPVGASSYLATNYPDAIVERAGEEAVYFRMSGTSMSTGALSGLVALVRQAHPEWLPGQVKQALMESTRSVSGGSGRAVLADAAVAYRGTPASADDDITPNYILIAAGAAQHGLSVDATGAVAEPLLDTDGDGVGDTEFRGIRWRDAEFEGIRWRGLEFEGIRWRQIDWSGIRWRGLDFEGIRWRGADFEGIRWRGIRWRGFVED